MKKPVKNYDVLNGIEKEDINQKVEEFYMCEYIDAYVKKPLQDMGNELDMEMKLF